MKNKTIKSTCFIYFLTWIYLVWVTLPDLLLTLRHIFGKTIIYYIDEQWVDLGEHTVWPYLYFFCPAFIIFMIWFGFCLRKAGTGRVILTVGANLTLPCIAFFVSGEAWNIAIKHGVIGFMFAIVVLLLTISTVLKALGNENKAVTIIRKATPFVAAAAIVVMLVSAFIPAENFKRKRNSNVTLDLSQYTVSDIAEMSPDELGELAGKYNEAYAPFD